MFIIEIVNIRCPNCGKPTLDLHLYGSCHEHSTRKYYLNTFRIPICCRKKKDQILNGRAIKTSIFKDFQSQASSHETPFISSVGRPAGLLWGYTFCSWYTACALHLPATSSLSCLLKLKTWLWIVASSASGQTPAAHLSWLRGQVTTFLTARILQQTSRPDSLLTCTFHFDLPLKFSKALTRLPWPWIPTPAPKAAKIERTRGKEKKWEEVERETEDRESVE